MFLCKIKTMLGAQAILRIQIHMANNVDPDEAHLGSTRALDKVGF